MILKIYLIGGSRLRLRDRLSGNPELFLRYVLITSTDTKIQARSFPCLSMHRGCVPFYSYVCEILGINKCFENRR